MSEVKRYICATLQMWDSIGQPARLNTEQLVVLASDFDRVTAERDALQALLTAADERADVLEGLLIKTNEMLYTIQGDPGLVPSSAIDAMRGKVFTALKNSRGSW